MLNFIKNIGALIILFVYIWICLHVSWHTYYLHFGHICQLIKYMIYDYKFILAMDAKH